MTEKLLVFSEPNCDLQLGEVYEGKIALSRGPVRGRKNTNVIVRSPAGVSRQLALAEESQKVKQASYEE